MFTPVSVSFNPGDSVFRDAAELVCNVEYHILLEILAPMKSTLLEPLLLLLQLSVVSKIDTLEAEQELYSMVLEIGEMAGCTIAGQSTLILGGSVRYFLLP